MKRKKLVFFLNLFIQFFIVSELSSQSHWETVIYAEVNWHYFVGTTPPPPNWNAIDFDDSGWPRGQGGFGYGDGDDNTIITNTLAVFFRVTFHVSELNEIINAVIHGDYDDGFVAYINGVEIARSTNMGPPGSSVSYNQTASVDHEATMYQGGIPETFKITNVQIDELFTSGENVFSVEIHNVNSTSSDMSGLFFLSFELNAGVSYYGPTPDWFYVPTEFATSHLPIVIVNTNGQVIPNDNKITAHMGVIDNGPGETNHLSDPYNHYDGFIGIELRGSSTLWFPKKQFAIETRDSLGENNNVSLFGMPEENDWIFNAPYTDKSLMRNVLIYNMARDAGRYASRTHYFELVLNDDYRGVYVMLEKVKRDDNRVDISKLEPDDISGDDVTGGYIIKIDKWDGENLDGWYSSLIENDNDKKEGFYQYHYPKPDDIVPEQQEYIINYIDNFEQAMNSENYTNTTSGYPSIIHWDSFVDFLIMQEITKNIDGYRLSSYLYKDKDSNDGRLVAGPIWDFNLGFGNANYDEGWDTQGWMIDLTEHIWAEYDWYVPFWWCLIWSDERFQSSVSERWRELRKSTLSDIYVNTVIDSLRDHIGVAANRNFDRWPILGEYVWPNYFIGETYEEEVEYLRDWIMTRMEWMDNELLSSHAQMCLIPEVFGLNSIYPNPFNHKAFIQYLLPIGTQVNLDIFNIKGEHVFKIYEGYNRPGVYTFNWDGINKYGQSATSGMYIIMLKINNYDYNYNKQVHQKVAPIYLETRKVILVK